MSRSLSKWTQYFFCVLAIVLFILACNEGKTGVPEKSSSTATVTPTNVSAIPLGAGLNGQVNYSRDFVFVDAMKTAGAFRRVKSDGSLDMNNNAPVDSHGWPTTDFGVYVNEQAPIPGTYKFSGKSHGNPTLSLALTGGAVQNQRYNPTTQVFTADIIVDSTQGKPGGPGQFIIVLRNTKGGVTNIKLIRPGYDPVNPPVFTTPYLNLIKGLSPNVLRFMDWRFTNSNVETDWSDRSLPTDATQVMPLTKTVNVDWNPQPQKVTTGKGIAWEYCIQLANELRSDMWINIPLLATDDYVTQLAKLIQKNLKEDLKVYVEYSNEVWNDSFLQTGINRKAALNEVAAGGSTLNYDGAKDPVTLGDRRVAKRLKEISDIFGKVFGNEAINRRIRPVLAYQIALNRFDNQLTFINKVYGPPNKFFWAIAVAPYFNLNGRDSNPKLTVDEVLAALSSSIDSYQNSNTFDNLAALATQYGLKLTAYEGGPDTFGPNNIAAKKAATFDPRMKDLCIRYLNVWYTKGGDQFNWFTIGAGNFDTQYGTWSITDDVNDLKQPKVLAFQTVRSSPLPAVTVGSVLPGEVDARAYMGSNKPYVDPYVRYIGANSNFDYPIRVPKSGTYNLKVSIGTSTPGATLDVLVNTSAVATASVPSSSSEDTFVDTAAIPLNLQAGLNVVRLHVPTNRPYNINSLKFYKADGSGISNTLPMLGGFGFSWQQTIARNTSFSQSFTVNDAETHPANLIVSGSSDNTTLVPKANIVLTRSSTNPRNFSFTVNPAPNKTGVANITISVKDGGGLTRSTSFKLTVS